MRTRLKPRKSATAATAVALVAAGAALAAPGAAQAAPGAAPGTQVTGTLANGTVWIAEYPASWNGTLLLYSHGFGPLTAAGQARLALAMAFLNVTPWEPTSATPAPRSDPAAQESAEYDVLFGGGFTIMDFIELGRISVEQADGGQATWDVGTNFARVLRDSPYRHQVEALYKAAGLNLGADLATLTAHTSTKADPAALRSLYRTSVPAGRLAVPELDLHTVGDNLVPVQNEDYYRHLVDRAGSGSLLRQAYTASFGHCNFSPAELVAGVQAVMHRVTTGHWNDAATASGLQQAATALNLGAARFTEYRPGELTGEVPAW